MPPLFPVIIGPTAGGKSALAMELALGGPSLGGPVLRTGPAVHEPASHDPAELISADSIQIYRGLDIGSAKPSREEQAIVRHHLIDIANPADRFTVHDWLSRANEAVADIQRRGKTPIVVGGTHLYIKAFLEGLFEGPPGDPTLREILRARGLTALREELERVDPAAATKIHPNDDRRTIRALEVLHLTGKPITEHQQQWDREHHRRKDCVLIALWWPAELINPRINARVKEMIDRGLVEETRALFDQLRFGQQSREALGYKQLIAHFEGRCTLNEAVEEIKIETRRFAKNQRTWLKRLRAVPGCVWIEAKETSFEQWAGIVRNAIGL